MMMMKDNAAAASELIILCVLTTGLMAAPRTQAVGVRRTCLPGQQVVLNATSRTVRCVDCQPGTFSKDGRKCYPCTVCHSGQVEIRSCRSNRNRICQCLGGTYLRGQAVCTTCSDCPPGHYQTSACSHNMNRSCRRCPAGMTTNTTNSRVCAPMAHFPYRPPHHQQQQTVVIRQRPEPLNWWVPLIPGVFVVLTGVFAIVFYWRSRRKKTLSQEELSTKRKLYDHDDHLYSDHQVIFISSNDVQHL